MALVFTEEFSTTTGTTPTGWTRQFGNPVNTSGGYRGQCCLFDPVSQISRIMPGHYSSLTCFFVNSPHTYQGSPLTLSQSIVVGTTTTFLPFLTVRYGGDTTLQAIDNSANVIAAGVTAFGYRGMEEIDHVGSNWTFIQLDASFSATTIGSSSAIKVIARLHCNGESVGFGTSTFLSNVGVYIDTIQLNGVGNVNSQTDSLYLYDSIVSGPIVTPNEVAGRAARISQTLFEHINLPSTANARVTQSLIEHMKLPTDGNARITQAVIELILAGGGGWIVYES